MTAPISPVSILRVVDSCGGAYQHDESDDWNRGYNEALTAVERELVRYFHITAAIAKATS